MPQNDADPLSPHGPGWPQMLLAALELGATSPDFDRLARIARLAAAVSGRDDDGPATAFLAGYAAGLAEGTGQAGFDRAHAASLRAIERLVAARITVPSPDTARSPDTVPLSDTADLTDGPAR